ncbi:MULTISPECIES: cation-translocating P-type ATPase [unclassified Chelatococcus]|uniref:cation-translocating P-type ATPase n=1 Tax=unclassified Chelatococcus TaxID=2638111 RepID=UPI001BD16464|nr:MULTISPECIES: cation-translocating P-type ATPase [unclassified Chelatococcus]CAH1651631.1 Nitrogen fixation protein FixI [Hyphomicrobiales bacterium]MBS7743143.1 cadmium-translocating P-type ATPase [Chelatococcus sp. HY11]MBX3541739.1 cadmium-translocating P-type ATPase [Chelatococcus sp.]MCO5074369.1 cadmium-translocating P-type ATPase [Chelatococcus sp.]CAH1693380.1 Nitrogen fixation protein FixI [Hyphomicrobiales bacterium]
MTCCALPVDKLAEVARISAREEFRLASRDLGEGLYQTDLSVPGVRCAACIRTVENGLLQLPGLEYARVNLSTKRATVKWRGSEPPNVLETLDRLGFPSHLSEAEGGRNDPELGRLIRALGVAGFSSMNIMLLSVSVWSGADAETRQAFHWISAALALPCLIYSGRVFFVSAWGALRHGRTNMDVPISIGVCLAFALSLYDTIHNGRHAYFDAATSLIFFLLIGRTLDHLMREKARAAVRGLVRLAPRGATVLRADGSRDYLPVADIEPGMRIALAAGDRVPVDGVVADGMSDLDCAIATGEGAPQPVQPGSPVQAGTLNLSAPLTIIASVRADNSFLSEMVRLMEAAEGGRARYRRLADRAARLYSPVVHATAFLTFIGWMVATGDWHRAITIAIAVLIVTCPCALGLAVPIVQVVAARRLFDNGIMVKDGAGLERLAEIDTIAFDKTGTLTLGRPRLLGKEAVDPQALAIAAALGTRSNHPYSRAIAAAMPGAAVPLAESVERPGLGIEARIDGALYRLGRAEWALSDRARMDGVRADAPGTVLSRDGALVASFTFEDALRPGADAAVARLRGEGVRLCLLSGDREAAVAAVARRLGVSDFAARLLPAQKVARLEALADAGHKVLMVGDGLNDAPALAKSHVSMAPATAADIGRNAADFVFLRDSLDAVPVAMAVAREGGRLIRQNFALAIIYNVIALPIAIAGFVTPLIAALAMSLSSVIVVANALRLGAGRGARRGTRQVTGTGAFEPALGPGR